MFRSQHQLFFLLSMAWTGLLAGEVTAVGAGPIEDSLRTRLPSGDLSLGVLPRGGRSKQLGELPSLRKLRHGTIDVETAVRDTLLGTVLHPSFGLKSNGAVRMGSTGRQIDEFAITYSGFPLCDYQVKAHTQVGKDPIILGKVPGLEPLARLVTTEDFPGVDRTLDRVFSEFAGDGSPAKVTGVSRCLKITGQDLTGALIIAFTAGGLPYTALANDEDVYSIEGNFFSVSGTVDGYKKNKKDGKISTYTVDLVGDGTLTTTQVITATGSVPRATNADNIFKYAATDPEFAETSAFVHLLSVYAWYKSLGYKWSSSRLQLRLREEIPTGGGNSSKNNALYVPSGYQPISGSSIAGPVIAVGDGDGTILQDLPYDTDVVTHEFGHHVIFRTLTSTSQSEPRNGATGTPNHSAALHEGLADYFTFAYQGDACLAESICPTGTTACWIMDAAEQCLRSGKTDLVYGSEDYWALGNAVHLKGQIVSGTMWDIRTRPTVVPGDFDKIAYASLDYLQKASTYGDWLTALMAADKDLFAGKYGCDIVEGAKARGLSDFITKDMEDCKNFVAPPAAPKPDSNTDDDAATVDEDEAVDPTGDGITTAADVPVVKRTEKRSDKEGRCGTVATFSGDPGYGGLALIILLLLPTLAIAPRPSPVAPHRHQHGPKRKNGEI